MSFRFSHVVAIAAVFAAAAGGIAHAQPRGAQTFAFDRPAFEADLHTRLDNTVKGYAFVLMHNNLLAAEGARGQARNARDGQMTMTTATPVNIGSLFKFVAGVSLLHAVERPPAGSGAGANSFDAILNSPYIMQSPGYWNSKITVPQIQRISVRQLLQHKSGFRDDDILVVYGGGYQPRLFNHRDYQNLNFTMAGYWLGAFVNRNGLTAVQSFNAAAPFAERFAVSQTVLGREMDRFIRTQVLSKVSGGAVASCDAANEFRTTGAHAYRSRLDRDPGIITSRMADGKPCIGAGGYQMSARHLAGLASTVLHTDRLISARTRALMLGTGADRDDRLVFSSATSNTYTNTNFGESHVLWSGGRQPYDGGQVAGGGLVRLPQNYVLVVLYNSPELESSDVYDHGLKAFKEGMKSNFP